MFRQRYWTKRRFWKSGGGGGAPREPPPPKPPLDEPGRTMEEDLAAAEDELSEWAELGGSPSAACLL